MTKILALDLSTAACSVAIAVNDEIYEQHQIVAQQHAQLILPIIQSLLAEADLALAQLDAIAFGCGPGSFTGLRLAAGVTQGLAFGADLPVIPISSLQVLAQTAYRELHVTQVISALDARMQEVYWGAYQFDDNLMIAVIPDSLCQPANVSMPEIGNWVGVGDAWLTYELLGSKSNNIGPEVYPHARDLLTLATAAWAANKVVAPEQALPVYLRAKTTWSKHE